MGELIRLQCPECGYDFEAMFGNGVSEEPNLRARARLEADTALDEASFIYSMMKHLGKVSVIAYLQPYACPDCRKFFNSWQAVLHSGEGYYAEDKGVCPACGKELHSKDEIRQDEVRGTGEDGRGPCRCRCPKCRAQMRVTGSGTWN